MSLVNITITIDTLGSDAGPFDITDNLGNTIATGVTASQLLAGYQTTVDDTVTSITACSTGTCTNCRSVSVNLKPVVGNCISYRFTLSSKPDSGCRTYIVTADPDVSPNATFQGTPCGLSTPQSYTLSPSQSISLCLSSPPIGTGISYEQTENDCSFHSETVTYIDCDGNQQTATISTDNPELNVCGIENQYSVNTTYVTVQNFGICG